MRNLYKVTVTGVEDTLSVSYVVANNTSNAYNTILDSIPHSYAIELKSIEVIAMEGEYKRPRLFISD